MPPKCRNWKRENRLFTPTVLEAGASGAKSNRYARTQKSSNGSIRFRCSNSFFFFIRNWHCWPQKAFPRQMIPQSWEKLLKRRFFDTADRHEKLYGRSRLYASAQGRHETGGILSLFSSLSFDISIKNSVQRWSSDFQGLFRVKIRKMAQGSNDLSTLPLIDWHDHATLHRFLLCSCQVPPRPSLLRAMLPESCLSLCCVLISDWK